MKTTFLENEELHTLPVEGNEAGHENSHEEHDAETEPAEEEEGDEHEDDQHEIQAADNHDEPGEDDELEPTGIDTNTEHEAE